MKRTLSLLLIFALLLGSFSLALADDTWTCPACGHSGNTGNFCPNCGGGRPQAQTAVPSMPQIPVKIEQPSAPSVPSVPSAPSVPSVQTPATTESSSDDYDLEFGDIVTFGSYEQDNNFNNGMEELDWIVLGVSDDGQVLLMSLYGLMNLKYTDNSSGQTWANCTLRQKLNNDFFLTAFSPYERQAIVLTDIDESASQDDPDHPGKRHGSNTQDYVFILSYGEMMNFFPNASDRLCNPTKYSTSSGGNESKQGYKDSYDGGRTCWYWLRNPAYSNNAGAVDWDGTIATCYMNHPNGVVRPCIVVDLNKLD